MKRFEQRKILQTILFVNKLKYFVQFNRAICKKREWVDKTGIKSKGFYFECNQGTKKSTTHDLRTDEVL